MFMRLFLLLAFAVQILGFGELLHAEESHDPAACEAAHGAQDGGDGADREGQSDCHWHCGTCVHPNTDLPVVNAVLPPSTLTVFRTAPVQFLPAPPSANIFHPPA